MSKLNDFLKNHELGLTLTNEQGETYYAGNADFVKPLSTKTLARWHVKGDYSNIYPFTLAIIHGKRDIFSTLFIKPVLPGPKETVIEVSLS